MNKLLNVSLYLCSTLFLTNCASNSTLARFDNAINLVQEQNLEEQPYVTRIKTICRKIKKTGSHLPKQVCQTNYLKAYPGNILHEQDIEVMESLLGLTVPHQGN